MWNSFSVPRFGTALVVALPILTGISLGCSDAPPTSPSETSSVTGVGLALTGVSPQRGLPGDLLRIVGYGFNAGTGLTIGGADTHVIQRTSTVLTAFAPSMPSGSVDVTVANSNGERKTLPQAFTFDTVAISASPTAVAAGGPLNVTFGAPSGRSAWDWVGLFRAGDVNENYLWFEYTGGSTQGTITIPAPTPPGDYQFRYFADDGYIDAARSGLVTVTDAPTVPLRRLGRGRGR